MKKWLPVLMILVAILTVWSTLPGTAQSAKGNTKSGVMIGRRLLRWNVLAKQLNLTEEQKTKIRRIVESARQEAQKVKQNSSLAPQEKRNRLRDLRRNTRQEIHSVLTPEQIRKLQRLRTWRWHRWQALRAYRAGKAAKALGLSKAQEQAIANILRRARAERRRIWSDTMLTPQQKWQRALELRHKVWNKMRNQLTPEQQRKLRVWLGMRRWDLLSQGRRAL